MVVVYSCWLIVCCWLCFGFGGMCIGGDDVVKVVVLEMVVVVVELVDVMFDIIFVVEGGCV